MNGLADTADHRAPRGGDMLRPAGPRAIIAEVAWHIGLPGTAIIGRSRQAQYVRARAAVVWLARRLGAGSTSVIGRALDGRDHSTVLTAWRKAEGLRQRDPAFRWLTDRLLSHFREIQED